MALWKVIIEEDTVFIPKIEARNFPEDFYTRNFLGRGRVSRYAATPLIVALSPGHSDITKFRSWSSIATENHLDRAPKKIPKLAQTTATDDFLIRVQTFRNSLRGELPHAKSS